MNNNIKILLLTKKIIPFPRGGRDMLSKINHDALSTILGDRLIIYELPQTKSIKINEVFDAFRGYIDGLTNEVLQQVLRLIKIENISKVFVDGSNLGEFVAKIKSTYPNVEVITFFHNAEARFFWGALKTSKTARALAVFILNYLAERKAAQLSDKRICLSERDSQFLRSIYGKSATDIAPMVIADQLKDQLSEPQTKNMVPFALFVGGNFYANRDGIDWFVKHVARRVDIKIIIVGLGMDKIRTQLEIPGKVNVIGPVDNLFEWYRDAHFVIAPLFDGSGMKTKIAEALMYGKKIIGTPEAFSGYDVGDSAGWVCRTSDEFVSAITAAQKEIHIPFNEDLRAIYLQKYSFEAAKQRLEKILF
jgi:glycosyltransferase involved in cell wall biosynthesis